MTDPFDWYDTTGGPHLLVPEELLPAWRGIEGWSPETHGTDDSRYSKACAVPGWVGTLPCGDSQAIVLGGDVGAVAWIAVDGLDGGYLVQWLGIDDPAQIPAALQSKSLADSLDANAGDAITLDLGASRILRLLDSSDIGDDMMLPNRQIQLASPRYWIRAALYETENLAMVVRKLEATRTV